MSIFTRLWNGVLALFGKKPAPADPYKEALAIMSQLTDLTGRLSAALTRIAADKAGQASADAAKDAQISDLQTQLADAETQLENALQPIVDQAEAISPPPPPVQAV